MAARNTGAQTAPVQGRLGAVCVRRRPGILNHTHGGRPGKPLSRPDQSAARRRATKAPIPDCALRARWEGRVALRKVATQDFAKARETSRRNMSHMASFQTVAGLASESCRQGRYVLRGCDVCSGHARVSRAMGSTRQICSSCC